MVFAYVLIKGWTVDPDEHRLIYQPISYQSLNFFLFNNILLLMYGIFFLLFLSSFFSNAVTSAFTKL